MEKPCPVCGKKANPAAAPFCSSRCKQVDLYRWLDGHYRIPTDEAPKEGSKEDDTEDE